jgi:UDP:flavonoid glycosyltransferase YjiC (YdhE family)
MKAESVANAIDELLNNPKYREAARKVQKSFIEAGGNERAVDCLENFYETEKHDVK